MDAAASPNKAAVDDTWRQWIAENRLRDCSADSMITSMVAAGIDANAASVAVMSMERDPAFLAARRHQQLLRKLESVVANQQRLWEMAPGYGEIEKRPACDRDEFIELYACSSRPVVFTGLMADWPARWSLADLRQRFGDVPLEVQSAAADTAAPAGVTTAPPRPPMPLRSVVERLSVGAAALQITTGPLPLQNGPLAPLLADVGPLPEFCSRALLPATATLLIEAAGQRTPLQHAQQMALHLQTAGRSRWRFISPLQGPLLYNYRGNLSAVDLDQPDLARYPAAAQARPIEVIVDAGEAVFVPLGWWWQRTALELGAALTGPFIDLPNQYHYDNPDLRNW